MAGRCWSWNCPMWGSPASTPSTRPRSMRAVHSRSLILVGSQNILTISSHVSTRNTQLDGSPGAQLR
jgi:hypothetical protein